MRCVCALLPLFLFAASCKGDSTASEPPELVRKCGELEDVEPVEPIVVGRYPSALGADGGDGCPMFAPVPCTRPVSDYATLCGTACVPETATNTDGDEWLVGCALRPLPLCGGPDLKLTLCGLDPEDGAAYWFDINECEPLFLPLWECWPPCEGEAREPTAAWCP